MPTHEQVTERYWTVCWAWIFPYPCRKTRTVWKWCYNFSAVHESCYAFGSHFYGCENGIEYSWWNWCFGWFDAYYTGMRICFSNRLEEGGPCGEGESIPPGGVIPPGAGTTNYALATAGSSMIIISAATILFTGYQMIQSYVQETGSIPASNILGIASLLGFGMLIAISALISFFKECQLGGMLSILLGILLLIFILVFKISSNYTLLSGIALNIIGAIINIRNSSHICE